MKERIYAATVEFLVAHGYSDFNFGLLAKKLHTTRANVHYHFVNKSTLIDYVVERYTQSIIDRWTDIWGSDKSYEAKVELAITFTRELFERYNPKSGDGSKPWSLISRMREDYRLLSEPSRRRLKAFTQSLEELIDKSVRSAQSKGELGASIDPEDIVLQMSAIIDNSPSITRIAGGHGKLERLYRSHLRLIGLGQHKASTRTRSPPPPPSLDSRPS